ncbi:MAG: hypothetical protein KAT15_30425 [Bacteroidales bacterium]|nr:hypothetical protein [Bacteroidales bacterium]
MRAIRYILFLTVGFQLVAVSCRAQVPGCTDPLANNFNPSATINDGSCTYDPISVSPKKTSQLHETLSQTSGLTVWDGYIRTHVDHADTKIYALDTVYADIKKYYNLEGVTNFDWEEIQQDDEYLYIGDFGNNSGNRTDLHLLRVEKQSLQAGDPVIDTIWFTYSDQLDFNPPDAYQTDFDCEAFIVSEDSIYLFTKQWVSIQTSVYSFPKVTGKHTARKTDSYGIQGLITGAAFVDSSNLIVLCGYTSLLHPFLWLFYDFRGYDFFSGNKRRITVSLPFHQVEGIATRDGLKYYLSNESFILQPAANNPQKLHIFDLRGLLEDYIARITSSGTDSIPEEIEVYPNPAGSYITVRIPVHLRPTGYKILDLSAKVVLEGKLTEEISVIEMNQIMPGSYTLWIERDGKKSVQIMKF